MGEDDRPKPHTPAPPGGTARAARLAEALRANLRRRKAQGRAREGEVAGEEDCGPPDDANGSDKASGGEDRR